MKLRIDDGYLYIVPKTNEDRSEIKKFLEKTNDNYCVYEEEDGSISIRLDEIYSDD